MSHAGEPQISQIGADQGTGVVRLWTSAEEAVALAVECAHPDRFQALLRFVRETHEPRENPFSSDKPTTPET
jgi:hypothetical protein